MSQTLAEQIAKLEIDVKTYGLTRDKSRLRSLKEKADAAKPPAPTRTRVSKRAKGGDERKDVEPG